MGFMNEIVQKVEQFNRESRERFQERLNSFESDEEQDEVKPITADDLLKLIR